MTSPHWSFFQQQLNSQQQDHATFGPIAPQLPHAAASTASGARPVTGNGGGGHGGASAASGNSFSSSGGGHGHSPSFMSSSSRQPSQQQVAGGIGRHSPVTISTWNSSNSNNMSSNGSSSSSHQLLNNMNNLMNNSSSSGSESGTVAASSSNGFREAGIVEKLLPSYGFIQCCERQARLFFHYSQFNGNIEHLKLGDPVEFEMTYDRRTGKPIASTVAKISNEVFPNDDVTNPDTPGQVANGFITTEPLPGKDGRVAYENRGECFFLPFTLDDVEPGAVFRSNDKVSFRIATDRSGNLRARKLTLLTNNTPDRFQGIVCTLKDSFGFIERADIVKEIFFHSSECQDFKSLNLGDDVEFGIQTRNDKKVAVDVRPLSPGSVVFEKVSDDRVNGVVMKMATRAHNSWGRQQYSQPGMLPGAGGCESGTICVITDRAKEDICFAIKDINGEFSLKEGDIVTLNIVTDKRDNMKHAGKIELHSECFKRNSEQRDNGYVASLKDNYGFIKCFNREGTRVYFKIAELLNPNLSININDEVEFTLSPDVSSPGRFQAIRIAILPNGTIMKSLLSQPRVSSSASGSGGQHHSHHHRQPDGSLLDYPLIDLDADDSSQQQQQQQLLMQNGSSSGSAHQRFSSNAVRSDTWTEILSQIQIEINSPQNGGGGGSGSGFNATDLLTSDSGAAAADFADQQSMALNNSNGMLKGGGGGGGGTRGRGFIAAVKDSYGFIEAEDHQSEIFFHFSTFDGNASDLEVGHDVEFSFTIKNDKKSAEYAKLLPKRSIPRENLLSADTRVTGKVIRTCRCLNPEQEAYPGIVQLLRQSPAVGSELPVEQLAGEAEQEVVVAGGREEEEDEKVVEVEFSMTSLTDVREFIQKGDTVSMQIGVCPVTGKERAVNMRIVRNRQKATIDTIKNNYGFINFDAGEDGKKLFFHISEYKILQDNSYKSGDPDDLRPGDRVEFAVVHNQKTNKYSACSLIKLEPGPRVHRQRPEHLISKLKLTGADLSSKIIAIRQPKGPDGTKGFAKPRVTPHSAI